MRGLVALIAALGLASAAHATPVQLVSEPLDDDGVITLGELFDNAGAAANVRAGTRTAASAVLDAAQVQSLARRYGLEWANPTGLRRIIVRAGSASVTPTSAVRGEMVEVLTYARSLATGDVVQPEDVVWTSVQAHQAPAGAPDDAEIVIGQAARRPLRAGAVVRTSDLSSPQVIARGDLIEVVYRSGGVSLSLRARAMENAAQGEAFNAQNIESGRTIEVVAAEPGRAFAGPGARR